MLSVGMIELTQQPPRAVNGIFGVAKGDAIRLIIDARPANALFADPPHVELPTPDILAGLRADAERPFFSAKSDADNYYHRFRMPEALRPFFALPQLSRSEISEIFGSDRADLLREFN